MQQGQPIDALPGRGGGYAVGFQGAVEFARAEDGVGEGEEGEGGEAEVEGRGGELQGRAVHDGRVDLPTCAVPGGGRGGGKAGEVGGDEVGADVYGRYVHVLVCCDGWVEQALGRQDHGTAGVVEDSEGLRAGGWEGGGDEVEEVVGEENVAAAGALVVVFGHGAGEGGAGCVVVVVVVVIVGMWCRGVEGWV